MDRFKAVTEKVQEVLTLAEKLYGVKINPHISFNLRGRVAGWAGCKFCRITGKASQFTLRFNCELIQGKHFDDMLNNTVPHEAAHLVCFERPELGRNHDQGWQAVCKALGGTGARCHNYDVVVRGRWDYITDRGNKVSVSKRYHQYVQQGGTLMFKRGLGQISKMSPCAPSGQLKWTDKPNPQEDHILPPNVNVEPDVSTPVQNEPKPSTRTSRTVVTTKTGELTWAEKVRRLIRAQKALGVSMENVIVLAIQVLGMTPERAKAYVKAHWTKV